MYALKFVHALSSLVLAFVAATAADVATAAALHDPHVAASDGINEIISFVERQRCI